MGGLITCRNLGGIGRAGNQMFLYAFARGYAEAHGAELRTNDWIGRRIFANVNEALVSDENLPQTRIDSDMPDAMDRYFGRVDIDLRCYSQHQVYLQFYTRKKCREWFTLKPEFERYAPKMPFNAAHIRRGDYIDTGSFAHSYAAVSEASYDRAIVEHGIQGPVTKICEGWRPPPEDLPKMLSWIPDWLAMRDAPVLLRANSTFSFWAGVLGHGEVYSPLVHDLVGPQDVPFVKGNWACTAGKFRNQSNLHLKEE